MIYLANSKQEFVTSCSEKQSLFYTTRVTDSIVNEYISRYKNVDIAHFCDDAIKEIFGDFDKFREFESFVRDHVKERDIQRIDDALGNYFVINREFNTNISLYPGFEIDDIRELAESIYSLIA